MIKKLHFVKLISAVALMFTTSAAMAGHLTDELIFSARLNGAQSVPTVATNAVGVASFTLNSTRDTACFNISVNGLSGAITAVHLHEGAAGNVGPVLVNLSTFIQGNRVLGSIFGADLSPAILEAMLDGEVYLNVHTAANPAGEIRGQVKLEKDFAFRASLDPNQQTHSVTSAALGSGVFNLDLDQTNLKFWVVADSLSGPMTAAHLHFGAPGVAGGVALNLSTFINGNTIQGSVDASTVANLTDSLLAGSIYINIHTAANPAGEIRGQVDLDNNLSFDSYLNTAQQTTPPTGANGNGTGSISISNSLDTLFYEFTVESLSGAITAAHLHDGALGSAGPVLVNLSSGINGSRIEGFVTGASVNSILISKLLSGSVYINVHTSLNGAGEIRGQVYRTAREAYTYSLESSQTVPFNFAAATGSGMISVDRDQSNAHIMMVMSGLTGPATAAHLHIGVAGEAGGVAFDLGPFLSGSSTDDAVFGYWTGASATPFTTQSSVQLRHDSIYVNVHTAANPSGEIRGQVLRGRTCFDFETFANGDVPVDPLFTDNLLFATRLGGAAEVPPVATNAAGVAGFQLNPTRDTIYVRMTADDLSGPITGIHIHQGGVGANGGVVHDLSSFISQNQVDGFITGFDLGKFISGSYYLNLHTAANPNGEIRGQIGFETAVNYGGLATGDQEVPAVVTNAEGYIVANLSKDSDKLEIKFQASELSGPVTAAHLHIGAAGTAGGVVENLSSFIDGNTIIASVDPSMYLNDLTSGNVYLNVHTTANPAGEIRAQLEAFGGMSFDSWLNGAQEVPVANSPASGVAFMHINEAMDSLYFEVFTNGLSSAISSAHLHTASIGSAGGVDFNLSPFINGNRISGVIAGADLTDSLMTKLLLGQIYINIHTASFPAGEIRGQVFRLARDGYTYNMCGDQEVPSVISEAYGSSIVSVSRDRDNAHVMFTSTKQVSTLNAAHIHNGAFGANGGVVLDLTSSIIANSGFTYTAIDSVTADAILTGNAYLNLHTLLNPAGEIRGQVVNSSDCPEPRIGVEESLDNRTAVYPNPSNGLVTIEISEDLVQKGMQLHVVNILGNRVLSLDNVNEMQSKLDLSTFPKGIYFLQFVSGEQQSLKKLVVN